MHMSRLVLGLRAVEAKYGWSLFDSCSVVVCPGLPGPQRSDPLLQLWDWRCR